MIIATYKNNENKYGRFFLATEAEPPVDHIHHNTKVLNISPNRGRRIDFNKAADGEDDYESDETDFTDDEEDSIEDDDTDFGDMGDDEEDIEDDDTDFNFDDSDADTDNTDDSGSQDTEGVPGDGNAEGDGASGGDNNQNNDTNGEDAGGPDTGDDTDFTDTDGGDNAEGGDGTDDNSPDTDDDPSTDNEDGEKGPGLEYSSTRKYALFLNYEILLNALTNYIKKLENNIGDDINTNKILKAACTKLREIKDLCYEYMLMKFELDTYVKALLFYQNAVIMIQSVFTLLKRIKFHKNKLIDKKNVKTGKRTLT